ncbi:hypothetical protein SDC9_111678 [bioreactor metagenome]|uniref:Uncharacterized protein n=1 Tax=bioreactor metagenome TaxID=1076179 RepID=A0A645BH47_9ZZZZ
MIGVFCMTKYNSYRGKVGKIAKNRIHRMFEELEIAINEYVNY